MTIKIAIPVLTRIAVAKVTDRSAHTGVVPQGAGLIIFTIVFLAVLGLKLYTGESMMKGWFIVQLCGLALVLSVVGFIDDMKGLSIGVRLGVQAIVAIIAIRLTFGGVFETFFNNDYQSKSIQLIFCLIFLIVIMNIVNFMDGMDLITVTQAITFFFFVIIIFFNNKILIFLACLIISAFFAFSIFNKPKAVIFLGDSGSLPLGLLIGVTVLSNNFSIFLNGYYPLTTFVILLSYYLADSGITLAKRIYRREKFWRGHKQHYYQQAMQNGQSVWKIIMKIFAYNCIAGLCAQAYYIGMFVNYNISIISMVITLISLILLLYSLARKA